MKKKSISCICIYINEVSYLWEGSFSKRPEMRSFTLTFASALYNQKDSLENKIRGSKKYENHHRTSPLYWVYKYFFLFSLSVRLSHNVPAKHDCARNKNEHKTQKISNASNHWHISRIDDAQSKDNADQLETHR